MLPGTPDAGPRQLVVARIGRPHGVSGELTIEVRTDDPDDRFAPGAVLATEPTERGPVTIARSFVHGGRWVLALDGVGDRAAAETLRDTLLLVDVDQLPPITDADEFYDHQLVGLRARLGDGTAVGVVRDVVHGPAGDLLAIEREAGSELLVPFRADMVPTVDVEAGYVEVRPPEGLLEL
ncbi:MAG: ribosome maturation factor RimM [Geodermatophilaceae bacterium]